QDKIKEAQEQLQQAQQQTQEELAREQLQRIADRIKGLKERQDAAIIETQRLHKAMLQRGRWIDDHVRSLSEHAGSQDTMAKDAGALKEKLKGALVFELVMDKVAEGMETAAKRLLKRSIRRELRGDPEPLDKPGLANEEKMQAEILRLQKGA